jgi:hypothetical protein
MRYTLERNDMVVKVIARRDSRDASLGPAAVLEQDGAALEFTERAPGLFEAMVPAGPEQEIRIVAGIEGSARERRRRLVSSPSDVIVAEKQVDPVAGLDFGRLARATGGQALKEGVPLPQVDSTQRSLQLAALWPWSLLLALLMYLSEIAWRRRGGPDA